MARNSDWLQDLTSFIAQPEGKRDVADTRESILRLIDEVLPGIDWVASLWLGESRSKRNILTLWHVTTAKSLTKPRNQQLYCIRCYPKNLVWPGRFGPAEDIAGAQEAAAFLYRVGLTNHPGLRETIESAFGTGCRPSGGFAETLLPLFGPDVEKSGSDGGPNPIGILQIVTRKPLWPLSRKSRIQIDKLMVLARGLAGRIAFSRTWRCTNALETFQGEVRNASDPQEVCRIAVDVLCRKTHAVQCIMFRGSEQEGVKSYASAAKDLLPARHQNDGGSLPASALVSHVFDRRINNADQTAIRLIDIYDEEELYEEFPPDTVIDSRYLSDHKEVFDRVSWMAVRIDSRGQGLNEKKQVPLAVLKLSTVPQPHYLGGAFSETDERVTRLIASYLGELLPNLLFRSFVQTLSPYLQSKQFQPEIESRQKGDEKILSILRSSVPTIRSAIDVERGTKIKVRAKASTSSLDAGLADDEMQAILDETRESQIGERRGRLFFSVSVLNTPMRERKLLVEVSRHGLGEHEISMIEHVASDMRLRQLGDVDVEAQLRDIVEIRHSLRHGLTGAINHVSTARETLEVSRRLHPDRVMKFLRDGARLRKSLEAAAHGAEEVYILFENARLLLTDISTTDLQLAPCNIPEVIRSIERNLKAEISRREIRLRFVDKYGQSVDRPVVDQRLIRIALFNILDNAIKYASRGRSVEVTFYQQSSRWYCSIEDVGRYIPESEKKSVFEILRRLTPDRGEQIMPGTGLGLPISLKIARAHHPSARIDVESEPVEHRDGQIVRARTTFTLSMPREIKGGRCERSTVKNNTF